MTVICVKKSKDKIEIASDSQTTRGMFMHTSKPKIIKYWDDCIIGYSWLLIWTKKLHKAFQKNTDFKSLDELEEFIDWFLEKDMENSFIMIKWEKVYQVRMFDKGNYESNEVEDFSAIGCWDEYAHVAHEFSNNLTKIVEAVCKFNTGCSGKIIKKTIKLWK